MTDMGGDQEFISDEVIEAMKEVSPACFTFLIPQQAVKTCFGLQDSLDTNLKYSPDKVQGYCSSIIDACIRSLSRMNKPFKYVVTCIIQQNIGAGIHMAYGCYHDQDTDGATSTEIQINDMIVIVTVFANGI